jgi:ubiquitin C-terminal hydrolase
LSEGQPCDEKENDLLFHHYINAMKSIASYEREQSDHRSILKDPQQKDKDNREEAENSLTLQYYELKQKIPSIERMIARTNSYCATPFSGTIQSTLECSVCHHMKKSNSSFLEIPIVPMELSRIGNTQKHNMETVFQICTLQDCLDEFVADETIHDYNCLSCSLILERKRLDEEEMMTRDAIMFQMRKKHQDDGKPDSEVVGLEHELNEILSRREFLSTVDPNDDENERIKNINDYDIQCHIRKFESIPKPRKVNMIKRLHIQQLPPILCFHVKRLYYDTHSKRMNKSVQHVQFGEFFDANCLRASDKSETLDDQCNYRLMSVVVHTGNAYSGHYFTYRRANHADIYRNSENGKDEKTWVMVSDETLTYVSWNQVSRCEAYLLVYELF